MSKLKTIVTIVMITFLFTIVGFGYSRFIAPTWSVEMKVKEPTITALGNYYPLFSMYNFIEGRSEREQDAQLTVYKTLKDVLQTYDMKRQFWLDTEFYKQRVTGDKEKDRALLNKLIDSISIKEDGILTVIKMQSTNPKQAVSLMKEFMQRVNFDTRALVYNRLIIKWKTLFNEINLASQLQLGKIKQGTMIDIEDWTGKLKMMKSAKTLDKKLIAYSSVQTPTHAMIDYTKVIYDSILSAIVGFMISLVLVTLLSLRKQNKNSLAVSKD